jgi:mono/diheme cytochrome c family protein
MKNTMLYIFITLLSLLSCNDSPKSENQNPKLQESIQRGEAVYSDLCITCHLPDGKGVPKIFPPLANSDYLKNKRAESIKAIKYGMSGEITVNGVKYNTPMAALGLTNKEVADVMNYITNSWGNKNDKIITEDEVSKIQR